MAQSATLQEHAENRARPAETGARPAETGARPAETGARPADTRASLADTRASLADTRASLADTRASLADTRASLADTRARPPSHRRAARLAERADTFLRRHNIAALRMSLGVVFLAVGALKFFPGASPAAPLVERTIDTLTFGVITGTSAVVLTAVVECFIGLTLVTGKLVRPGLAVLAAALVGIMSPLVLFLPDMFPHGTPTLEAQYVFKDIVLAAAGLVVAVSTTRAKHRE